MIEDQTDPRREHADSDAWEHYWEKALGADMAGVSGTAAQFVREFWLASIGSNLTGTLPLRVLDVACGRGGVASILDEAGWLGKVEYCGVDISHAAVRSMINHFPSAQGVVADVQDLPLLSGNFDIVCSQFGVEYAGEAAILDLVSQLRAGGQLILLLHCVGGQIYKECYDQMEGARELVQTEFLPLSMEMFKDAYAVLEGGERRAYEGSSGRLVAKFRALEDIMRRRGRGAAAGMVYRLYRDVNQIHRDLPRFQREQVLSWLQAAAQEVASFAGRMDGMCASAMSESQVDALVLELAKRRLNAKVEPMLTAESGAQIAWQLTGAMRK
ncbi:bifunctional 2-polyprenyl-6-hydroxyphenol methylase/3-demethylubiquinol 3-O-methyltransferase UbiG [Microbulbifer sp. Q7]|uniref:class I SAM-dependent methyltransferase n=1 Tax=Microbulbifer sp. Q7 TaxID=1785091 RepID=UPI000831BA29|nr:class I SAM-dependent methyltransferase [Microbulbifer sp. Q7]